MEAIDMNYKAWFEKYRPREIGTVVFPNQDIENIITGFYNDGFVKGNILSYGPPGFGKAQPNSELVLTPSGWVTMGSLRKDDLVVGADGKATKILETYPQGMREIYEVGFADGNKVRCDGDHIWKTWQNSANKKKIYKNRTTKEMLNYKHGYFKEEKTKYNTIQKVMRWSIPLTEPIIFDTSEELLIDCYAIGLLLGDGSFRTVDKPGRYIWFSDKYHKNIKRLTSGLRKSFKDVEIIPHTSDEKDFRIKSSSLAKEITKLGLNNCLSIEKRIPPSYLYAADPKDRLALLWGLLNTDSHKCGDTDSKCSHLQSYEYYTSSKRLMDDFIVLVESLGIYHNPIRVNTSPKYTYKEMIKSGQPAYSVVINMKKSRKSITSIEKLDIIEESTCIMVENPDHLYITRGFTVTHNTTISEVLIHKIVQDRNDIFILGRKIEDVENLQRWLMQRSVSSKQKVVKIEEMDRLSPKAQIVLKDGLMEKYQHSTTFLATTNKADKIDPALITRFNTRINFGELPIDGIKTRLEFILATENITYDPAALEQFVKDYQKRGLRDLINNLELASTTGTFNPKILDSFIGISGNEDLVSQYIVYLIGYLEGLSPEKIKGISTKPSSDEHFFQYYDYMLKIFKNELRLNFNAIYQDLSESALDFSAKNIVNDYWQDLELKRFPSTHTISLMHALVLNILEQKGA